ncbi:MAG: MBL fold metallo-hydrolase [Oscillospiraceae bacterium]
MKKLTQLGAKTYCIEGSTNIGIYLLNDVDVCLIDSGPNESFAREILDIINSNGWNISAVMCTHSHADHIGGNGFLQRKTGCKIYASPLELPLAAHSLIESAVFFGAYPNELLRSDFFMAQPSSIELFGSEGCPEELEIIPLGGHFLDMVGIRTPDGVLFLADSLAGEKALDEFHITFMFDVKSCLETIEFLSTRQDRWFVPSHSPAMRDIGALCQKNALMIHEIKSNILSLLVSPLCLDDLLEMLFTRYSTPVNLIQYTLVSSTVRSFLSYLSDLGLVAPIAEGKKLKWVLTQSNAHRQKQN